MARVEIAESLLKEMSKKFKREAERIIDLMETLEENPHKGKLLAVVKGFAIKELKYKSFRFFFILENEKIRFYSEEGLTELLIRFVRMAHKKEQQQTIEEIREALKQLGPKGLE